MSQYINLSNLFILLRYSTVNRIVAPLGDVAFASNSRTFFDDGDVAILFSPKEKT